jgi:peptidoglycan/LPS O-acetylase OafA/YrhL
MQRFGRLDGLRGLLAVYVMLGHALPFTDVPGWLVGWAAHGAAAVDLFFCLSGFVVINSLERYGFRVLPFFGARVRRLVPVYWCVLALAVGLSFVGPAWAVMNWVRPGSPAAYIWVAGVPGHFTWHLLAHLAFLQGILPAGLLPWAYLTLLGPAWSLSTEWQFYGLMAGFFAWRPDRVAAARWMAWLAYGLAGAAVGYHAVAGELPPFWRFSRAFLPDAAGYFALGLASAAWLRGGGALVLVVTGLVAAGLGLCSGEVSRGLIPVGWGAVLAAQFCDGMPVLPRLLEWRPVRFLGAVSYPLYLVNEPVQRAAALMVAPWVHGDVVVFTAVWLPLALGGPVLAAWGLHRWVEGPAMRWRWGASRGCQPTLA